jgi:chromate transporter
MHARPSSALQVLLAFLKLGLTSFGGPIAHLGYFHQQFVERMRWLDEAEFTDLIALCQFLPGATSSQVGMAIGLRRAGALGAAAAWVGFTLPSALLLVVFAQVARSGGVLNAPWLHGLLIAAVAVVAQAVWSMGRQFCARPVPLLIAVTTAIVCALIGGGLIQLLILAAAACVGWMVPLPLPRLSPTQSLPDPADVAGEPLRSRLTDLVALVLFAALLIAVPVVLSISTNHALELAARFFRAGSLVFGGGHVVLPLLQAQVVPPGWISNQSFLAGYAAAQAVPGPLFSFAAYLGAAMTPQPNGWPGAAICLVAIFLPSFLLVVGVMPFWATLRQRIDVRRALAGINAAVVGILLAALYTPVFTSAIHGLADLLVAVTGFLLLLIFKLPSWALLLLCAGYALARAPAV